MTAKQITLTRQQKKVLRKVGERVSDETAVSLGKLTEHPVLIEMIAIKRAPLQELSSHIGESSTRVVGSLFYFTGDLPGHFLMVSSQKTALALFDMMVHNRPGTTTTFGPMEQDAVKEIANILVGSYLSSLSDMAHLNVLESVPRLILSTTDNVIDEIDPGTTQAIEDVLLIETKITLDAKDFTEHLVLILHKDSLNFLMKMLVKNPSTQRGAL